MHMHTAKHTHPLSTLTRLLTLETLIGDKRSVFGACPTWGTGVGEIDLRNASNLRGKHLIRPAAHASAVVDTST